ncbi:MAG: polysaccharide biosynthesis protein [Acidimicrobiia bacterium]|nr:polysaccharide biosynthesis protein [Acidimicrobiia bacterium]
MPNHEIAGANVLITGGTGSFGHTMAAHLLDQDVGMVRVLSRDEAKQHDMRVRFADRRLAFYVGDVRDQRSVDRAMRGIDLVFHAAALKQVPTAEFFPLQAVWTNVLGSANVIESAQRAGVASVVCLSTDKAVMPINAMGMTKALMEKVAQAAARANESDTVVSTVRYGNVLYSRGSVVPLFVDQVLAGRPMTITNPDMTRFLMPLRQAVDLVDFAFANANPGDVFVRKAPAATIADLAAGTAAVFDVPPTTEQIGVRHGEKVFETLATAEELAHSEDLGDYFRLWMDDRDLNYSLYFSEGDSSVATYEEYNSHNTDRLDAAGVTELLLTLPEIQAALAGSGRA